VTDDQLANPLCTSRVFIGSKKKQFDFPNTIIKATKTKIDLICKELVLLVLEISIITNLVFH